MQGVSALAAERPLIRLGQVRGVELATKVDPRPQRAHAEGRLLALVQPERPARLECSCRGHGVPRKEAEPALLLLAQASRVELQAHLDPLLPECAGRRLALLGEVERVSKRVTGAEHSRRRPRVAGKAAKPLLVRLGESRRLELAAKLEPRPVVGGQLGLAPLVEVGGDGEAVRARNDERVPTEAAQRLLLVLLEGGRVEVQAKVSHLVPGAAPADAR